MKSSKKKEALTLSDLEHAIGVGAIQMAQRAFDNSNQGIGDVPRLQMLVPKLKSWEESPNKAGHENEIKSLIEGIENRIDFLQKKG